MRETPAQRRRRRHHENRDAKRARERYEAELSRELDHQDAAFYRVPSESTRRRFWRVAFFAALFVAGGIIGLVVRNG